MGKSKSMSRRIPLQLLVRYLPSTIKKPFADTKIESYYHHYLAWKQDRRGTQTVNISLPCGDIKIQDTNVYGGLTNPENWGSQANYPEPVIVEEFCKTLDKDDVFYDIGSAVGFYANVASAAGVPDDQIYCFEPDSRKQKLLAENVSDKTNQISKFVGSSDDKEAEVITLDSYVSKKQPPTVIKMDIQGQEYNVILGMEEIMEKHRPHLYIEVHPELMNEGSINELIEILEAQRYVVKTTNHRSQGETWSEPNEEDFFRKSENGIDYFLRATPQ